MSDMHHPPRTYSFAAEESDTVGVADAIEAIGRKTGGAVVLCAAADKPRYSEGKGALDTESVVEGLATTGRR